MDIIKDEDLGSVIQNELKDFVSLSSIIASLKPADIPRHMVGRLLLEASKCEELLDFYGAKFNQHWAPLRKATAATKAFTRIIYNLFHIKESSAGYRLLPIQGDFANETEATLNTLLISLVSITDSTRKFAHKKDLDVQLHNLDHYGYRKMNVHGKLIANSKSRATENPGETAVYVATSMLNLAEESHWLDIHSNTQSKSSPGSAKSSKYCSLIPHVVNEMQLLHLANSFHGLQSLYDTYLTGSALVELDSNLPTMRGQISIIYHLLDTAVTLIHYYERHALNNWNKKLKIPLKPADALVIIFEYFIAFSERYIAAAQELCRNILKSYAIQGSIKVPVPNYRGFHVRPSTLISKIVIHYGSDVTMIYASTQYDASKPLSLFRANEELNRGKRSAISEIIKDHKFIQENPSTDDSEEVMKRKFRILLFDLLEQKKVIIYDSNLSFDDLSPFPGEILFDFITRSIALYLATGKIDIVSQDTVIFEGDIRVLNDINILASNGYGEDRFGNNIVLPRELSYLKR